MDATVKGKMFLMLRRLKDIQKDMILEILQIGYMGITLESIEEKKLLMK